MKSFLDLLKTEERGDFNPIAQVGSDFPFTESSANDETITKSTVDLHVNNYFSIK